MLTKFFKGMRPEHVTQGFHSEHPALDIVGSYGTPLCAPENCLVLGVRGDTFTPDDNEPLKYGYGIRLKGQETGREYLFWHCLPYFPVWGGQNVKRGQIVAYMGNSGHVVVGGTDVPVENRLDPHHPGTHLHIEVYEDGSRIDPSPLINWSWEPQWTYFDFVSAATTCLLKMAKGIK
jgi:hypothetical protein